jgi:calcium/calmodulin-dependent protein kinase I
MVSIFHKLSSNTFEESSTWSDLSGQETIDQNESVLVQEELKYERNGVMKCKSFMLTNFRLYKINKSNKVSEFIELKWKLIKTFVETTPEKSYGFTISLHDQDVSFYVSSEASLLNWKCHLSKISISSGCNNDYVTIKEIASSKGCSVFLVQDIDTRQEFAMKKILKSEIVTENKLECLVNEIKIMRILDHPNIIKLHKVYESKNYVKLILDYCPHGNLLKRLLKRQHLSEDVTKSLARNLLETLAYIHSLGIIHRDIKLENILMASDCDDSVIKIADFGLSCFVTQTHDWKSGSPGYVAPEILCDKKYNQKVDVFSTGVVIYALLSGSLPFTGRNADEILTKNFKCKINFEAPIWNKISFAATSFLSSLLTPNQNARPLVIHSIEHHWLKPSSYVEKVLKLKSNTKFEKNCQNY